MNLKILQDIEYQIDGDGPPLVLIHGCNVDMSVFDSFVPSLTKYYQVIRYNLPGIGKSKPLTSLSVWQQAGVLLSFLNALELSSSNILGMSYGGWIALAFASSYQKKRTLSYFVAHQD